MRVLIIFTVTLATAWGQLQQGYGKVPGPYVPGQAYYPYPNNPYQYNYPYGYPFNNNNNNYSPYFPAVPQVPIRGGVGIVDPPVVPVPAIPVIDLVPSGITGSVPLSPLEAALTQLDHRNKGHSEKYFYGRHGLGPAEGRPKEPSTRARHYPMDYSGGNVNYNYNGNYPGLDYSYNYNYPQYQPQYQVPYPQYQAQYPVQYPVQQYPYNSYYPDNVNVNLDPVGVIADPYLKKPTGIIEPEVNLNVNGGKKPFSVKKPEHYELYTYHR